MAIIENEDSIHGDAILMRLKKPNSPYKETWYLFGCDPVDGQDDHLTLQKYMKDEWGVEIDVTDKQIEPGYETKIDSDGIEKDFIYKYFLCRFLGGKFFISGDVLAIDWKSKEYLSKNDIVPPSVELFTRLGYIK